MWWRPGAIFGGSCISLVFIIPELIMKSTTKSQTCPFCKPMCPFCCYPLILYSILWFLCVESDCSFKIRLLLRCCCSSGPQSKKKTRSIVTHRHYVLEVSDMLKPLAKSMMESMDRNWTSKLWSSTFIIGKSSTVPHNDWLRYGDDLLPGFDAVVAMKKLPPLHDGR